MRNSYRMESGKMTALFANISFLELVNVEGTIDAYIWYKPKIKIEKKKLLTPFNSRSDMVRILPQTYKILGTYAINIDKILSAEVQETTKRNVLSIDILFDNMILTIVASKVSIEQFVLGLR